MFPTPMLSPTLLRFKLISDVLYNSKYYSKALQNQAASEVMKNKCSIPQYTMPSFRENSPKVWIEEEYQISTLESSVL